jgi:succinyl-CoA synthetase beta subunit
VPSAIITTGIHPTLRLQSYQTRKIARQIGLGGDKVRDFEKLITAL